MHRFLVLFVVTTLLVSISFTDGAKPKAKVPKGHAKTRHAEVVDLLTSVAEKICEKLAKDHRKWRKGKKWVTRCDLFVERVENMAVNTGNQLIGALNKTMAEVRRYLFLVVSSFVARTL